MRIEDLPRLSDDEREAADDPCSTLAGVPSVERKEPALYTLGLTVPELLGQLSKELIDARGELGHLDTMISVAGAALRSQDCDIDSDVADVLQNVAWGNLDNARHALEVAQQLIARLEQLQEKDHA